MILQEFKDSISSKLTQPELVFLELLCESLPPHFDPKEDVAFLWSIMDVQTEYKCTALKAMEVLRYIKDNHDATIGVNWDVIGATAEYFDLDKVCEATDGEALCHFPKITQLPNNENLYCVDGNEEGYTKSEIETLLIWYIPEQVTKRYNFSGNSWVNLDVLSTTANTNNTLTSLRFHVKKLINLLKT